MSRRILFLDASPGERRGVVMLDGRPERLLIDRDGEAERARIGDIWRGRLRALSRSFVGAFVDLGLERDGLMKLDPATRGLTEGAAVEVEVIAEARGDKGPALRFLRTGEGRPERLAWAPPLRARLQAFEPTAPVVTGEAAREAADEAEEAALASRHPLARGAILTLDRARALTAIDVDMPDAGAGKKAVLDANLSAVRETARLVRLKSLGGLVVIDLIGGAREHEQILKTAREAFAADDPGVVYAGVSRLGVLEIARPWRERPLSETLCDRDGRLSARSAAARLLRALEREGRSDPGARLVGVAAPEVAEEASRWIAALGPRFSVAAELGRDRFAPDIRRA